MTTGRINQISDLLTEKHRSKRAMHSAAGAPKRRMPIAVEKERDPGSPVPPFRVAVKSRVGMEVYRLPASRCQLTFLPPVCHVFTEILSPAVTHTPISKDLHPSPNVVAAKSQPDGSRTGSSS